MNFHFKMYHALAAVGLLF